MRHCIRTGTIVCSEDCHFLTLKKIDYDQILAGHMELINKETINFLKTTSIFSDWSLGNLETTLL